MKATYKRDLNHNYLILEGNENTSTDGYEVKMLMENKINGFLSMSTRYVNESLDFYYEISSKQSMERVFENKEMGYETIKNFLFHFKQLLTVAEEFLINTEHLLMQPEYLYMDLQNGEIAVVFHPDQKQNIKVAFQNMAEYFLNKVNHEDSKAVILAYQLYKNTRNDNFTMKEMLTLLQEDGETVRETVRETLPQERKREERVFLEEEELIENKGNFKTPSTENTSENAISNAIEHEKENQKEKWALVVLCLLLLISLILIKTSNIIEISHQQFIIGAAALIMGMTGIIITIYLNRKRNIILKENDIYEESIFDKIEAEEPEEVEEIQILDFLNNVEEPQEKEESYGNTVFLRSAAMIEERKLVGKIRGKEVEYHLKHFPFTIGKMGSHVDMEVKDNAISRMHARFVEKNGAVYLEDLNSTNGTYKNDLPLEANEIVKLEAGDEISFAKVKFLYC